MRWHRVKTVLLHSWYHFTHSVENWVDLFYFGVIDLLVFGLVAVYLAQSGAQGAIDYLILGLLLWRVLYIAQYSVSVGMMWEVWSRSFSTLFVSPLTMPEFLTGQMLGSIVKSLLAFGMIAAGGWWLYDFNILRLGPTLWIYFVVLLLFGWTVGMFVMGLIIRFGITIQSLSWGLVYIVQPLGAVFFPLSSLPSQLQIISKILPATYVFEAARTQLQSGVILNNYILLALLLDGVYLVISYWFLQRMIRRAKDLGAFVKLEQ